MRPALSTAESKGSTDVIRNSNISLKLLALLFSPSFLDYTVAYTWRLRRTLIFTLATIFPRKKERTFDSHSKNPTKRLN